ncbi:LysR family transcriptional regulator [Pseudomonas taiwanensis]|uniref:LysR family transcriptional regulator n=1 Tax=Pseudomonas taiwanensis TaxID=470150 RepID=A0ABR6V3K3_9PSED|nr:LysR family transcriptional regulator [Pseudomonas taiwanensis]MBC3475013.1 LysR family transcriptional regulator [Pseudomonas taiwanensis]
MKFNRSDFADLSYFLTVARHLNFRRAAIELGITASAVSHSLKGLEERLNLRLLNRTSRSVTLTAAGEELRDTLSPHFQAISQAVEGLTRLSETPSGHIRLNVPAGASEAIIAPVLPIFFERYPNILVDISVTNRMIDVTAQGFDAGIRYGGTVPEDMVAQRLSPDTRWVVAGTPAYFDRYGIPMRPEDLMQHRCVQIRLGDERLYRWEFEKADEKIAISVPGPVIVDDGSLAMKFALSDTALVYMNEWDVKAHVKDGSLKLVLGDWSPLGEGYYIYYSSRRQVPIGVVLLIKLIKELGPLG